jgi:hypothetical protein
MHAMATETIVMPHLTKQALTLQQTRRRCLTLGSISRGVFCTSLISIAAFSNGLAVMRRLYGGKSGKRSLRLKACGGGLQALVAGGRNTHGGERGSLQLRNQRVEDFLDRH